MILNCPGTKEISLLGGVCAEGRVFSVLVKPYPPVAPGPAPPTWRGSDGLFPHILYKVGRDAVMPAELPGIVQGSFTEADAEFVVEFDAGTFSCCDPGSVYLTGGDETRQIMVSVYRYLLPGEAASSVRRSRLPRPHWHRLTTLVPAGTAMVIPDYHEQVSAWTTRAGVTLENVPITLGIDKMACIPGTQLVNPGGADLMVNTYWFG